MAQMIAVAKARTNRHNQMRQTNVFDFRMIFGRLRNTAPEHSQLCRIA